MMTSSLILWITTSRTQIQFDGRRIGAADCYPHGGDNHEHFRTFFRCGGDSVLEQTRQAFRNLEKAMEAAGGTLKDIVALRIYVVDYQAESGTAVGTALREFFSPENPPASTWIGVSALADPEFLIEIEATAVLD